MPDEIAFNNPTEFKVEPPEIKSVNAEVRPSLPTLGDLDPSLQEKQISRIEKWHEGMTNIQKKTEATSLVNGGIFNVKTYVEAAISTQPNEELVTEGTEKFKTYLNESVQKLVEERSALIEKMSLEEAKRLLTVPFEVQTPEQQEAHQAWYQFFRKTEFESLYTEINQKLPKSELVIPQLTIDVDSVTDEQVSNYVEVGFNALSTARPDLEKGKVLLGVVNQLQAYTGQLEQQFDISSPWSQVGDEKGFGTLSKDFKSIHGNLEGRLQQWDNLILRLRENAGEYSEKLKTEVTNYIDQITNSVVRDDLRWSDKSRASHINIPTAVDVLSALPYSEITAEEVTALQAVDSLVKNIASRTNIDFSKQTRKITQALESADRLKSVNELFTTDRDLFWHVCSMEGLMSILTSEKLMSRSAQLEELGEATFFSAGLQVKRLDDGQYQVTHNESPDKHTEVVSDVQLANVRGDGGKSWGQEVSQICFDRNQPYMYAKDISFVFPRRGVLADKQFMVSDGWHVFDKDFNGSPDSPGFSMDLKEVPFVIVMTPDSFAQLSENLLDLDESNQSVLGMSAREFMNQRIMVVKRLTDPQLHEELQIHLNLEMEQLKTPQGRFIPTGNEGETAVRSKNPLVAYK